MVLKRAGPILAATLALAGACAPAAWGATETEPNDDIAHANGPLEPETVYEGSFQVAGDHDRFMLYANPGQEVDVAVENLGGAACASRSIETRLLNADGRQISSHNPQAGSPPHHYKLAPSAAPARYYVLFADDCAAGAYRLSAGPAAAVTTVSPAGDSRPRPDPAPTGEPNDDIAHALPIGAGTTYGGQTDSPVDEDWYVLYANPQQLLDVAVTKVGAGCSSTIDARLYDADGDSLKGAATASNETAHMTVTTPPFAERYYVHVYDTCAGDAYQLQVGPGSAIAASSPLMATAPSATPVPLAEPDDLLSAASGPLRGGTSYGGDFGSTADVDHAYFYSSGRGPLDVAVTKVGRGCSSSLQARLVDPSGTLLESGGPANNRIWHFTFNAPHATAYVLRFSTGCAGDPYQVRIDPASGVSPRPPRAFTVRPRVDRKPPYRFTVSGNLLSRLGLARAAACRGGTAVVTVKARRRTIARGAGALLSDCSYKAKIVIRKRRMLRRARTLRVGLRVKNRPELARFAPRRATVKVR